MKTFLKIVASATLILLFLTATSCVVLVPTERHDNGKHKGWFKTPHHQSPSKENGKGNKGHSKGKHKKH